MTFFNRSVEWFEREPNPSNGSVVHMKRTLVKAEGPRWSEKYLYDGHGPFQAHAESDDDGDVDVINSD